MDGKDTTSLSLCIIQIRRHRPPNYQCMALCYVSSDGSWKERGDSAVGMYFIFF
jgi:hypothetical protein